MEETTVHIESFNQKDAVCGASGHRRIDRDWEETDRSPSLRRCAGCENTLGPGGLAALKKARHDLAKHKKARTTAQSTLAETARARFAATLAIANSEARSYDKIERDIIIRALEHANRLRAKRKH